jgi:hypothetical protein
MKRLLPSPFALLLATAALLLGSGCAAVRLANSARLIARPDFPAAKTAAPEWCRDALKTINALEAALESQ